MSRLKVGVAAVAAVIAVAGGAGRAGAQVTPGPRRTAPATPTDPSDTWDRHLALSLELGPGGVLTSYDANESPSALLFYLSLIARVDIKEAWSGGVALRQWWLPSNNHATMLGLTARFEPVVYDFGRVFADVAIGATTTNFAWALGFDLGGGIEWNIPDAPGMGIGPFLRYSQVINPDRRVSNDGRAWALGGSFTYHFGRAAAGAKTETGPRRGGAYRLSVPDTDRDGVGDDEDVCKTVPQGKHPDPFKPGCPENDEDGDDVPDADDACPVTPPGPTPDPKRPGCPLVDTDKDGIPDPEDACPLKAGPANAEAAHNGCPMEKKHSAAPEEAAPPAESTPEPTTVKKRSRMK